MLTQSPSKAVSVIILDPAISIDSKLIAKLPLNVAIVMRENPVLAGAEETTLGVGDVVKVGVGVGVGVGVRVRVGVGVKVGLGFGLAGVSLFPIARKDAIRAISKRAVS